MTTTYRGHDAAGAQWMTAFPSEYLLVVHDDGVLVLTLRPYDALSWGPPVVLHPVPAQQVAEGAGA